MIREHPKLIDDVFAPFVFDYAILPSKVWNNAVFRRLAAVSNHETEDKEYKGMNKLRSASRVLTLIFTLLLAVSVGLSVVGTLYGDVINDTLQIKQWEVVDASGSDVDTEYYKSKYSSVAELLEDKYKLIQQICEEGSVLLKNENDALPLAEDSLHISVFGRNSADWVYGTSNGAAQVNASMCDSLDTVLESFGLTVNPTLFELYRNASEPSRAVGATRYTIGELPASVYTPAITATYDDYNDAAIVVFSRVNGEGSDFFQSPDEVRDGDGEHVVLGLQNTERAALEQAKACSDRVIVLLNSDYPIEIEELKNDDEVDAILWCGSTGVNGLYGTARVIVGEASPSGHLTDTYAVSSQSSPAMQNFGDFTFLNAAEIDATSADKYVTYQEGIYVGYRYYETRYEDSVLGEGSATSAVGATGDADRWEYTDEVSYSFGYGLSYTNFSETITDWEIDVSNKTARMEVLVENTGDVAGKHVVQLYAQSPYTEYDRQYNVEKSAVQLLDFEKTQELAPGDRETVVLNIDLDLLASYDYTNAKTFIFDAGDYYFALGNGAHDALNNILAAKGYDVSDGMDYDGDEALVCHYRQAELDTTVFSVAVTGETITNHMDDVDLNYYGIELTYLTRSDWAGTFPKPQELTANSAVIAALGDGASYVPDESSQDFSDVVEGINYGSTETSYQLILARGLAYNDPIWQDILNQLTIEELSGTVAQARVGAFACPSIGFAGSSQSDGPAGIRNTYLAEEDEYKISATMFQSECILASTFSKKLAEAEGEMFGEDGLWTDVSSAWAPGSNTHRTPYGGRNTEYFSECSVLAGIIGRAECIGASRYGVAMAPKHFALNDQETNRGGLATFCNEQAAREIYLRAFEMCFSSGVNVGSMLATNRIGCTYSGAHYGVLQEIVREEWGMNGGFITDMIGGSASVNYVDGPAAAIAGTTMINCNNATLYAGETGTLNEQVILSDATLFRAIREDCHRNLYMWVNSNAMNGVTSNSQIVYVMAWWQVLIIGMIAGFAVLTVGSAATLVVTSVKKKEN